MDKNEIEKSLKYLEVERRKLWEKAIFLESEIIKKTSDYENEAKQSSKKASEFRNRSEENKIKIDEYHQKSFELKNDIFNLHKSTKKISENAELLYNYSNTINKKSEDYLKQIEADLVGFQENISSLNLLFDTFDELSKKLESLKTIQVTADDTLAKIETLHKNSVSKKRDIDLLHREIIGYNEKDEVTGEITRVEGLKDELQDTYDEIKSDLEDLNIKVSESKIEFLNEYDAISKKKEEEFSKTISDWEIKYIGLEKRITELLPNALSAGLSAAFHEKKVSEIAESKLLYKSFLNAIYGLIGVSSIPFIVSIVFLCDGLPLEQVVYKIPRVVFSILPLYIPVLWIAYSSNRKLNLSKRLIEEYTHKEVLSKTFEGLSKQINDLEDSDISKELRNKLLYNMLEVSSENPGKLISDYNKSDHPLMDALDKSVKLANSVEKLSNLPGIKKLINIVDEKSKKIISDSDRKVKKGLGVIVKDSKEEEEEEEEEKV